jgi:hypothetical protein
MAVFAALPIGGKLLALAGLTLVGSVIGGPVIALLSPPHFLSSSARFLSWLLSLSALSSSGFLSSGALGLTWPVIALLGPQLPPVCQPVPAAGDGPCKKAHAGHGSFCGAEDPGGWARDPE